MNTPGHTFVCGCLGKCAEVAVPMTPRATVLPTLEVSPRQYVFDRPATITTPNWGDTLNRTISLIAVAQSLTMSGTTITGPRATIQANPGPGLMVPCPPSTTPSALPCSVNVDVTTFKLVNGVYRST